jgi:hypothetical protein
LAAGREELNAAIGISWRLIPRMGVFAMRFRLGGALPTTILTTIAVLAAITQSEAEPPKTVFTTPDDLRIELLLSEPEVRQPVNVSFDERGRMWVVQYLQYPAPAGLKMLSHDSFWRAQYDKVPPPPPHHFVGADKLTIHEDVDGDGRFDVQKTFVEGLNIATSVCRGRGGVWVTNPRASAH